MREHTRAEYRENHNLLAILGEKAESRAWSRSTTVVKINATNRVDVRFKPAQTTSARVAAERLKEASLFARQRNLVYCDKVQADQNQEESSAAPKVSRRRCVRLTRYGAETVREACAILSKRYGLKVAFITLTLPGSTPEALRSLSRYSKEISNLYMQRVRDFFRRMPGGTSGRIDYVWVWEYQERGALHIHLAIGIKDSAHYKAVKKLHKSWWTDSLEHYSDKIGVDLFARADGGTWRDKPYRVKTQCNRVTHSVGRYMSKYVSKGAREASQESRFPPSRWWSVSDQLKDELIASRETLLCGASRSAEAEQHFLKVALCVADEAENSYVTHNPITGQAIGYTFFCNPEMVDGLKEHLRVLLREPVGVEVLDSLDYIAHGPPDANGEIYEAQHGELVEAYFDPRHARCACGGCCAWDCQCERCSDLEADAQIRAERHHAGNALPSPC